MVRFVPKESFTNAKEEYELHFPILFAFLHRYEPVSVIAGCENKELWINDLSAGIYILQVRGPLGVLSQKIIKSC